MSTDAETIRVGDFEARFKRILERHLEVMKNSTHELLDEYGVVITKRLEGQLVSTEEAMRLSPMELGHIISALIARRARLETRNDMDGMAQVDALIARADEMLGSYGPQQEDDVMWPVIERR